MYSYLYNWFYYTEEELIKAQQQIDFYETIILNIVNKGIITEQMTEKVLSIINIVSYIFQNGYYPSFYLLDGVLSTPLFSYRLDGLYRSFQHHWRNGVSCYLPFPIQTSCPSY